MNLDLKWLLGELERSITPPTSYSNGPIAFYPNKEEQNSIKHLANKTLDKCHHVLRAGREYLSTNNIPDHRYLDGSEFDAVDEALPNDKEAFLHALGIAQKIEDLIHSSKA